MDATQQVDVFFLRSDQVAPRSRPDKPGQAKPTSTMEATAHPAARGAALPTPTTPTTADRSRDQNGYDNVCFDTSPPESRTSMDSSFERKSISTVASYYSISFQSSLNELVSMSSSVQRKKVRFQLDKTRKPYDDEWSLVDFRRAPEIETTAAEEHRANRCVCLCRGATWLVICSGMVFCALLLHNVFTVGILLILGKLVFSTAVQLSGNPIGLLLLGLWTWTLYSSTYILPSLAGLQDATEFSKEEAVLVLMGANMAATALPALLSLAFICDRSKFRRAFAAAVLHYIYNVFTMLLILPIEVAAGMLYHIGNGVSLTKSGNGFQLFHSIVKLITDLIIQIDIPSVMKLGSGTQTVIKHRCSEQNVVTRSPGVIGVTSAASTRTTASISPTQKCTFLFESTSFSDVTVGGILLAVCVPLFIIIYACAIHVTKTLLRSESTDRVQTLIHKHFRGKCRIFTGCLFILLSVITVIIFQNNLVLLCICMILTAYGFLSVNRYYEILVGSNIGGAIALLIFAQDTPEVGYPAAMSLAISNIIFHTFGFIAWYPIPVIRRQPIKFSKAIATSAAAYRWFAILFILLIYAIVPLLLYGLCLASGFVIIPIGLPFVIILLFVMIVNVMQSKCPAYLPKRLRTWKFLPYCLRSLEPMDSCLTRCCTCCITNTQDTVDTPSTDDVKTDEESKPPSVTSSVSSDITIVNGHVPVSILKHKNTKDKRETVV